MSDLFSAAGQSTFTILRASFLRRIGDGKQHARIRSAPTEIAAQASPNFLHRGLRMLPHEGGGGGHEPRRAKAALLGVMFHKGFLH